MTTDVTDDLMTDAQLAKSAELDERAARIIAAKRQLDESFHKLIAELDEHIAELEATT